MDVTCEAFDDWTVVVHDVGLGPLEGRDELWDVEYFGFVKNTWTDFLYLVLEVIILDYLWVDLVTYSKAHWLVAIIATLFKLGTILELLLYWQFEKFLSN